MYACMQNGLAYGTLARGAGRPAGRGGLHVHAHA